MPRLSLRRQTLTTNTHIAPSIGLWTAIICLACTFTISSSPCFTPSILQVHSHVTEGHPPRPPSQYIGLVEIALPSPPVPHQLDNYPILITEVDSAHRGKVFDGDTRAYISRIGTIAPEARRVHVSNTVSSIIQFRAIDCGMESCELQLRLETGSWTAAPINTFTFNVYRLNAILPLNTAAASYKTRPPQRVANVSVVAVNAMTAILLHEQSFCQSDEVLTFELACAPAADEERCRAEWWKDKVDPRTAIFIMQHGTV